MTVKELFLSVGFDKVIDALRNTHRNERSTENVAAYKEAFDTICLTEFNGEGGEVTFDVTPREKWFDPYSLPMLARNIEGDYWENTVGKTVIRPEDNPFTDAELAGAILWGMTFYGFTRHARWSPFQERYTSYGERADRLEHKLYLPYIRDKREKRNLKDNKKMLHGLAFTTEIWAQISHGKTHQNRPKRKRLYRLNNRISQLKRMDKRQHLIDTLREKCGLKDPQLEGRLMKATDIKETWRDSHVSDISSRVDYLAELLTRYKPTLEDIQDNCDEVLMVVYTSEVASLTAEEWQLLKKIIDDSDADKQLPITFIKGIDSDAKEDISLQIILISHQTINNDENE